MYDDMTPQQRSKMIWISGFFAAFFLIVDLPLIGLMSTFFSAVDDHLRTVIEVAISAPLALLASSKIYKLTVADSSSNSDDTANSDE